MPRTKLSGDDIKTSLWDRTRARLQRDPTSCTHAESYTVWYEGDTYIGADKTKDIIVLPGFVLFRCGDCTTVYAGLVVDAPPFVPPRS
jgi:hypothetical protein